MKREDIEKANKLVAKIEQAEDILEAIRDPVKCGLIRLDIEAVCNIGNARRMFIGLEDEEFANCVRESVIRIKARAEGELKSI